MSQQSTFCWIRRCNRQYIFLPQFTLVSRCRARDEKFLSLKTRSQASSAIAANSVSSLPQQLLDPSGGGQMIAPILSRKRDNRERCFFPQKKGSQWTHSIPSRTERACSSPKHITHRLCVSSSVRQRWHGSIHLLKRFSTDIFLLTLQKQGPLKEKRGWCVPQVPLYARRRSLACVIGVHLPMPSALGVFNHASGNRSRWRRSQSEPRKRTQCRVPFGRECSFCKVIKSSSGGQSTQIKYLSKSTDTYNKILLQ